jgi:hypothetical protein
MFKSLFLRDLLSQFYCRPILKKYNPGVHIITESYQGPPGGVAT